MPFTEQQFISALATYLSKKQNKQKQNICVFFSYTTKTIYLYPFTDSAGGYAGV